MNYTNYQLPVVFFDSHGDAHVTCHQDNPGAAAFGPTGCSRPLNHEEAEYLGLLAGETHFTAADAQRRAVRGTNPEEFSWLPDGGYRLVMQLAYPNVAMWANRYGHSSYGGDHTLHQMELLGRLFGLKVPEFVEMPEVDEDEEDDMTEDEIWED